MLILKGIAGKFGFIVELLKVEKEKDSLFADFPIGATIQDGGKRKRSDGLIVVVQDIYIRQQTPSKYIQDEPQRPSR